MKTELVKTAAAAAGLTILAAAQDLSPVMFGAKPPFLLVLGCIAGAPTAIAAGLFTDALSGLPFGCSAVFFLAAALLARWRRSSAFPLTVAAAALYQMWLIAWGADLPSGSSVSALAYAAVMYPVLCATILAVKRHAGIDKPAKEAAV